MNFRAALGTAVAFALVTVHPAWAQVDGSVSVLFDVLPDLGEAPGSQRVTELRTRLFVERRQQVGEHVRLSLSGYVDGLVAGRAPLAGGSKTSRDAIVRPADLFAELSNATFDIKVGASRLVWGRLDEFQPTDVVNPIDLTRFLLEGRSEARLAVGLVRGRVHLPGSATLEGVVVPAFRASQFDQLDEPTSPFNVTHRAALLVRPTVIRNEPGLGWNSVQGGLRFTSTAGRVDWGVAAYRGFRTFPILVARDSEPGSREPGVATRDSRFENGNFALELLEIFPRFTMIGGDFEAVRGAWGFRGEVAAFVDDELQSLTAPRAVAGKSVDAGVGVDRRAGDYRVAANLLWSWRSPDVSVPSVSMRLDEGLHGSDVTLVVAADRSFARETRTLRLFAVYDPGDDTSFTRVIGAVSLRDNVWAEGSVGLFAGSSADVFGRLARRDFLYARLKIFF